MKANEYKACRLCARNCGVDRSSSRGFCGMGDFPVISRAALHFWEEPIISGTRGSGAVFFSGCSLACTFCQNREISRGECGLPVSVEGLAKIMLDLKEEGAHNINLVTPTHFVPSIREAIILAKDAGLDIPIVYNTGSYDARDTLRSLAGLVDIYLPDLKYFSSRAARLSKSPDYPAVAREAIAEMVEQTGEPKLNEEGLMKRGTVVRILLLPGHVAEAKLSLSYLYKTYGDRIFISLMSQYTPMPGMPAPLDRRVTRAEYRELCDYAESLGVERCFVQDISSATEAFIPDFDGTGVQNRYGKI